MFYTRVQLVWPVRLPGTGELRATIDAGEDGVTIERTDDGALVLTRGDETVRIDRPDIEAWDDADGGSRRMKLPSNAVRPLLEAGALTLFRPVGDAELALIAAAAWRRFPPRLPDQPIFYPVTNERYAREIAEGWNQAAGVHVVRFRIAWDVARRWPVRCAGAGHHTELWVPAEELDDFNAAIVGTIEELA